MMEDMKVGQTFTYISAAKNYDSKALDLYQIINSLATTFHKKAMRRTYLFFTKHEYKYTCHNLVYRCVRP